MKALRRARHTFVGDCYAQIQSREPQKLREAETRANLPTQFQTASDCAHLYLRQTASAICASHFNEFSCPRLPRGAVLGHVCEERWGRGRCMRARSEQKRSRGQQACVYIIRRGPDTASRQVKKCQDSMKSSRVGVRAGKTSSLGAPDELSRSATIINNRHTIQLYRWLPYAAL